MLEFFKLLLRHCGKHVSADTLRPKMNGIERHTSSMPYSPCSMEVKPS